MSLSPDSNKGAIDQGPFYESFFRLSPHPYVGLDSAGNVCAWNCTAEKEFGYSEGEIVGRPAKQLFKTVPAAGSRSPALLQITLLTANAEVVQREASVFSIETRLGEKLGTAVVFSAAASSQESQNALMQELQQLRKEQEDFVYSVSHDMRAPLRAIQGFANLLLRESPEHDESAEASFLNRIIIASERMEAFLNDLLIYSRAGRLPVELRPINVEQIVREIERELQPRIEKSNVKIKVQSPVPLVMGASVMLSFALKELIVNAVTYVAKDVPPILTITGEDLGDFCRIVLEDNGIGIEPEHFAKIFKPFERLHGADVHPGTGLGLAIAEKAIQRLGGKIGVESQVGKGSRFWIELKKFSS